jgi:hypothetical protein
MLLKSHAALYCLPACLPACLPTRPFECLPACMQAAPPSLADVYMVHATMVRTKPKRHRLREFGLWKASQLQLVLLHHMLAGVAEERSLACA